MTILKGTVLWVVLSSLFSSKKIERMVREAIDVCLQVLKESNKSRFDSDSVRNNVLIISHITFGDCCAYMKNENDIAIYIIYMSSNKAL